MRNRKNNIKRKKIKYCVANYHDRYDRSYVNKTWSDVCFLPNSKTSRLDPYDDFSYDYLSQKKIIKFIRRWLHKYIGKPKDYTLGEFHKLKWKDHNIMNIIWNKTVISKKNIYYWKFYKGFYLTDNNIIEYKKCGEI